MAKEFFKNLPDTSTPLTAPRLNGLLDGDESQGNLVVDSIRTKNMFGNYTIINGWIYGTGMRVNITNGNRMAFVKCEPNTTYTISRSVLTGTFRVGDYTSIPIMTSSNVDYTLPKAIVEDNSATSITYTTSSTAQYLIVHYGTIEDTNLNESLATIQVEKGSTATAYSPYQNLDGQEIYSTGEVKIGAWLGKPLYRKTIIVTSINANKNSINVNHGISNMDVATSIKGVAKITGANEYRPLSCLYINNSGALDNQYLFSVYGITPSQITLSYGNWFKTRFDKAYITLEYTKTTD